MESKTCKLVYQKLFSLINDSNHIFKRNIINTFENMVKFTCM